ncbi:MAG TPA: PAAR domain-containing protein [Anaerolineales bacterium]|nr:PAAR domain-containing protein [Anaerolineales bacterium]
MAQPAAKQGDQITAVDMHIVLVPSPGGPVPTPLPHPFNGIIDGGLSADVMVEGRPAATVGSTATNTPPHLPTPPGTVFQLPPTNRGTITIGSATVFINGKPAARAGDQAQTCADPVPNPAAQVVAAGTVLIG